VLERPAGADPSLAGGDIVVPPPPNDREGLLPEEDFERGNLDNQPQDLAGSDGAAGPGLPLWAWALLTVAGLGLSGLLVWRVRQAAAQEFTSDWTPILYERLQGWAERLNLPLRPGQTPYEHAARLGDTLPSGRPAIDTLTDNYVRYRFAGQPTATSQESWQPLRPIFWKAWMRKALGMSVAETGDGETGRQGDRETRRQGDRETRRRGDGEAE